jgi:hypothetical protein
MFKEWMYMYGSSTVQIFPNHQTDATATNKGLVTLLEPVVLKKFK